MTERLWYIKNCDLFERLTVDQLARLERCARMRSFPRNTPVYLPSDTADGVLLLAEGRVRLCSITPEGKQATLAFIEPGELFGELALLEPARRDEQAEAVEPSTIVLLPGQELQQLMSECYELTLSVTKLIGFRRKRLEQRLKMLLFRSNRDRLTHLLLELTEKYGKPVEGGLLLTIPLSHQDLASLIGTTRETVTLLLGQLQLEGLLKVARQRIVIRRLDRLAGTAELPSPATIPNAAEFVK